MESMNFKSLISVYTYLKLLDTNNDNKVVKALYHIITSFDWTSICILNTLSQVIWTLI